MLLHSGSMLTSSKLFDITTLTVILRIEYVILRTNIQIYHFCVTIRLQDTKTALDFGQEADDVKEALLSYRFSSEVRVKGRCGN